MRQWPVPIPHRPGALERYLRWRNAKARHPDVLAAQRKAVTDDPARLAEAVRRYTDRYGAAPPAPLDLVAIEITVNRFLSLNL
ncbi:hypothetical protein ACH4GM_41230 [Streptomyces coeruleorubidus]|uniref:hypothetical protein n=1 Tax=Streptomyces coeruleorubidus TaxID=116188 RepID=UPI00379F0CF7